MFNSYALSLASLRCAGKLRMITGFIIAEKNVLQQSFVRKCLNPEIDTLEVNEI